MKQAVQPSPTFRFYRPALRWAAIALVLRLVICLVLHLAFLDGSPNGLMPNFGDDVLYWEVAQDLHEGHQPDYIPGVYPVVLAGLFTIAGQSVLIGKLLNVIADVVTVSLGVLIVRDAGLSIGFPNRAILSAVNLAGCCLAFYPSQIFYSTQLVKDPILVCLGMFCLYFSMLMFRTRQQQFGLGLAIALFGLMLFRVYAASTLIFSLLIYLLFIWRVPINRKVLLVTAILVPCAFVPRFLGYGFFASDYLLPWLDLQKLAEFREHHYSTGTSAADISIDYSSFFGFVSTYSLSYLTVLLGPFPWQVRSLFQAVALPEVIAMFGLTTSLLLALTRKPSSLKLREANLLLILGLLLVGVIAIFSDSTGGNTRLRLLAWDALLMYTSLVIQASRIKLQRPPIAMPTSEPLLKG